MPPVARHSRSRRAAEFAACGRSCRAHRGPAPPAHDRRREEGGESAWSGPCYDAVGNLRAETVTSVATNTVSNALTAPVASGDVTTTPGDGAAFAAMLGGAKDAAAPPSTASAVSVLPIQALFAIQLASAQSQPTPANDAEPATAQAAADPAAVSSPPASDAIAAETPAPSPTQMVGVQDAPPVLRNSVSPKLPDADVPAAA
ncbi:MAG TPA: hypothetical protein VGB91_12995, partial [Rhizomicrobium sp.]